MKSKGGKPGELMESAKRKYLSKSGRFLLAEARQQKEQNKKDTKIILKKAKLANKYTAWAVDGGLQCGVGWGLVAFKVPEQAPRALLRGLWMDPTGRLPGLLRRHQGHAQRSDE